MIESKVYKEWYSAMDACNSGALIIHFAERILPEIWKEAREQNQGTDYVNSHPLVVLLSDKLYQLAHCKDVLDAYKTVRERSEDDPLCTESVCGCKRSRHEIEMPYVCYGPIVIPVLPPDYVTEGADPDKLGILEKKCHGKDDSCTCPGFSYAKKKVG